MSRPGAAGGDSASGGEMRTECFIYQLIPGSGRTYDDHHRNVWPEVQRHLRASGIVDYSIYRRGDLVISVLTRDLGAPEPAIGAEAAHKVAEWGRLMAPLFVAAADENGEPLFAKRIFNL